MTRRGQVIEHGFGRRERPLQGDEAVDLREVARRLGWSYGYSRRLCAEGRFPIPALPRLSKRSHLRFSPFEINSYLNSASVADAIVRQR